ncbi:MAG TPA: septum formation initiator family protein [Alphaproteobacteria bacterium]
MFIWRELKRRARDVVGPVLGFCVVGYFVYHSIEGDRGLTAYVRLSERLVEAQAQLDEIQAERKALERRVKLLRADNLDPDMLDERARVILNYSRPDEIIIPETSGPR